MRVLPPKSSRDGTWFSNQVKKLIQLEKDKARQAELTKWLTELGEATTLISSIYAKIPKTSNPRKKKAYQAWVILLEA